ncbi:MULTISPECIES: PTS fructose-like transporter subunit IIB [Halomonadaceae]|jgi:PTS system fructose-specific IIC component|uniref:protein-N(pi)-phosphohistidine--D-fructose phosphotransferase n=1 Tax=Vreelandella titanicae TaxID=664683 RepID=A0A6N0Z0B8_9GAMM|nr:MULTISPECIES: PTS fructose-like transporter subunit IIB [Halomonas]NAO97893.1 PTS fructose-like transporter subunit IIB [Halomonas sp. MG34]NVE91382.1 PTS fructose-like transporter subunit IIB [Halomonas titanicae]PKH62407.1 PTS fructose-specific transporter subunit EIIBC [Halomonas sp. Choline-3u-9]QKS24013.1 PTS system fructose-specific EIIB'BC component [Halomonas titanicae]QNU60989.1 PTS fructose-like transporter subunit IIB [Halomonas titanicae]
MNIILITACPSGMATTFLAAKRLEQAAQRQGWSAHVEMHGEVAPLQAATAEQIANADLIVVAADHVPAPERFEGKRLFQAPIASALPDPSAFLAQAKREAPIYSAPAASTTSTSTAANSAGGKKIVAVTACPTGVAHTFMAAEALAEAGKAMGHAIRVETQGSVGAQDKLTEEEIADADIVVLACDIDVDPSRFAGKRIYRTSTGNALKKPRPTLEAALSEAAIENGSSNAGTANKSVKEKGVYKHLLTGVSFMLPMVVAGGLLIALSFVFGIEAFEQEGTLAAALMQIGGGTAFALMIPVLAGYIAYSIADRPGIAPGMIGGMLAANIGSGFIGGILAGFLAGYVALAVTRYVKLPSSVESLKPILIIPLVASLVTGLTMIYVIGEPVAALLNALTSFLESMGSTNAVLLGILLGAMMCFDLGGPVNKAAYTFGVGLLASETYGPMAAIMAAGMVPAIGMGIASFVARNKFSAPEREAGKASFVLGLCFISEGAIPFAAKDPLRVIPACMVGGALTGALSMLVGAQLMAPHGGIFVLLIPNAITPVLLYLGAIVAGSLVTGLSYAFIKRDAAQVALAT